MVTVQVVPAHVDTLALLEFSVTTGAPNPPTLPRPLQEDVVTLEYETEDRRRIASICSAHSCISCAPTRISLLSDWLRNILPCWVTMTAAATPNTTITMMVSTRVKPLDLPRFESSVRLMV